MKFQMKTRLALHFCEISLVFFVWTCRNRAVFRSKIFCFRFFPAKIAILFAEIADFLNLRFKTKKAALCDILAWQLLFLALVLSVLADYNRVVC